jgi:hypothetical protein
VRGQLDAIARDTQATFGGLDQRQLNWRPDETRWSVAPCFEHLLTANRLMFGAAEEALNDERPRTIWQRLPVMPGMFGRMLIRSQSPDATRKFTASPRARPTTSASSAGIIPRFVEQHREAMATAQALDERAAARAIMTSPFVRFITYSVLDGWRRGRARPPPLRADGRRIRDVVLGGASHIVKIGGRHVSDASDLDFDLSEIVDVKRQR